MTIESHKCLGCEIPIVLSYYNGRCRLFCSRTCSNKNRDKIQPFIGKTLIKCEICGIEKLVWKCAIKNSKHLYCSSKCKGIGWHNLAKGQVEVDCLGCGKKVMKWKSQLREQSFCSIECRNKNYTKVNPSWRSPNYKEPVVKQCEWCQKEFSVVYGRRNSARFCSCSCRAYHTGKYNHRKGSPSEETKKKISDTIKRNGTSKMEKNPAWRGGVRRELYGLEFYNKEFKTSIRKSYNFTCVLCKENGYDIHHIDRNKKNNDIKNLIILCRHCHPKVHHHYNEYTSILKNLINGGV